MRTSKQIRREAKALFRICHVNGVVNENRVREVVQRLLALKPRAYLHILVWLQRLVKLDLERRAAKIESAGPLAPELQNGIERHLISHYGPGLIFAFDQNPALLGGVRVRVGSDVYDGTVHGRLTQLQEALSQ